jgi:hypothetical protein
MLRDYIIALRAAWSSAAEVDHDGWKELLRLRGAAPPDPIVKRRRLERSIEVYLVVLHKLSRGRRWRNTCLYRSVAVANARRRLGDAVILKIGVRRSSDVLSAHAWVEDPVGQVVYGAQEKHTYLREISQR